MSVPDRLRESVKSNAYYIRGNSVELRSKFLGARREYGTLPIPDHFLPYPCPRTPSPPSTSHYDLLPTHQVRDVGEAPPTRCTSSHTIGSQSRQKATQEPSPVPTNTSNLQ
ncbi:hypothetical protein CRENBAI_010425 [Crenichthys baileyi]|uniref:Uncharacterized protein n=1 Tax=Crenichthys baileyi TaxID=28760 RepID=A0AAV9QRV8_9TELE